MKQFNLLKEVHGMRARLMGVNYLSAPQAGQSERKFDKNNVYVIFLLIIAGFILYQMYPMLEFSHAPSSSIPITDKIKKDETDLPPLEEATSPHLEEAKDNSNDSPPFADKEEMRKIKEAMIKRSVAVENSAIPSPKVEEKPPLVTPLPAKKEKKETHQGVYTIRVATCMLKESADVVQRDLKGKGFSSYLRIGPGYIKGKIANLHRVYVGNYNSKKDVLSVADKLKANGFSAVVEERKDG